MKVWLCLIIFGAAMIIAAISIKMNNFVNESFNAQWNGNGNYSEQHGITPPKHYISSANNGYIMNPGNYLRLPWTRKTFYSYPFFQRRYVTRPILNQLL